VVYGLIRTSDAVSHLSLGAAIASLSGFVAVYALLLGLWIRYIVRTVRTGPEHLATDAGIAVHPTEISHA
jgi:cytochrome d ubiquinol oxidase subunit I